MDTFSHESRAAEHMPLIASLWATACVRGFHNNRRLAQRPEHTGNGSMLSQWRRNSVNGETETRASFNKTLF